jgi:hypothetical protein
MTIGTLIRDVAELRRRWDLAETCIAQQAGQFEFISGQLRDVQLYLPQHFAEMDGRFDKVDDRLDTIGAEVKALPRAIAELIAKG